MHPRPAEPVLLKLTFLSLINTLPALENIKSNINLPQCENSKELFVGHPNCCPALKSSIAINHSCNHVKIMFANEQEVTELIGNNATKPDRHQQ